MLTKMRKTCSKVAKRLSPKCCGDRLCWPDLHPVAKDDCIYGNPKNAKVVRKFCCGLVRVGCQRCNQKFRLWPFFKKSKKIMLTNLNFWAQFWKFMVRKSKSMYFAKLEKGNRILDILEMSRIHHRLGLFKTGLFYKVFKNAKNPVAKNGAPQRVPMCSQQCNQIEVICE